MKEKGQTDREFDEKRGDEEIEERERNKKGRLIGKDRHGEEEIGRKGNERS